MDSDTQRIEVIELINEAKRTQNADDKQQLLAQVFEIAFNNNSELMKEFFRPLLHFDLDDSAPIRKFLITVIEDVCRADPTECILLDTFSLPFPPVELLACWLLVCLLLVLCALIGRDLPIVLEHGTFVRLLLQDKSVTVVKRAVLAVGVLFKKLYETICKDRSSKLVECWDAAVLLKDKVLDLMATTSNDGVLSHCIKFAESLVLLYSAGDSAASSGASSGRHPLVPAEALKKQASQLVQQLVQRLAHPPGSSSLVVLVNALASVGRQRLVYVDAVTPYLAALQRMPPAYLPASQRGSVMHALKTALPPLLKVASKPIPVPQPLPWPTDPSASAQADGSLDPTGANGSASSSSRKRQPAAEPGPSTAEPAAKRSRETPAAATASASGSGLQPAAAAHPQQHASSSPSQPPPAAPAAGAPLLPPAASVPVPQQQQAPTAGGSAASANNIVSLLAKAGFTLPMLVQLIFDNMHNLPPPPAAAVPLQPPPSTPAAAMFFNAFISAPGPPLPAPAPPGPAPTPPGPMMMEPSGPSIDQRRDPRQLQPPAAASSAAPLMQPGPPGPFSAPTPTASAPAPAPGPFGPAFPPPLQAAPLPLLPPAPLQQQLLPPPYLGPPAERSQQPHQPIAPKQQQVQRVAGAALSAAEAAEVLHVAIERIINSEAAVSATGHARLRHAILPRLAGLLELDDPAVDTLIAHIVENFAVRKKLAVNWLLHEMPWSCLPEGPDRSRAESRYNTLFMRLLSAVSSSSNVKDRSVAFLFADAPRLPAVSFGLLGEYCLDRDRITIGLATLRDIILQRPTYRLQCLDMVLQFAVHSDEWVRSLAIRLVSNKLYVGLDHLQPLLVPRIREFALGQLEELTTFGADVIKAATDTKAADGVEPNTETTEVTRRILLYLALTVRTPTLLSGLFETYARFSPAVRRVVHANSAGLVKSLGPDCAELLEAIKEPPSRAEALVLHMLSQLLEANPAPPARLLSAVRNAFSKKQDVRFLIPVLHYLSREEIMKALPKLVSPSIPSPLLKSAFLRLLPAGTPNPSVGIAPSELLLQLHLLEAKEPGVLKKVIEAIGVCLEAQHVFRQEVLAAVLQQLVDVSPIPPLFLRTVIQSVQKHKKLTGFVLSLLSRLVSKQVWNDKALWEGFVRCCKITLPDSMTVVAGLPKAQLESALQIAPDLRGALVAYSAKHTVSRVVHELLRPADGGTQVPQEQSGFQPTDVKPEPEAVVKEEKEAER
eukprot:TRINITY_DN6842_c0_g1_i3.p1 TRINITY_DN6842_c0_g1~~TRINITY_DN6842_c0_g1_i3.p1  ORF type:complete len:1229 (+),score=200.88 TRINITY_DN6842_c0_g1_i3:252-3938(+)